MAHGLILVVEDHQINRQMLQAQLKAEEWDSHVVATGAEALAYLSSKTSAAPAAIVSDYILDDMTGIELLHQLRAQERRNSDAHPADAPVPVILYSGMPAEYLREQSGSEGYMAILTKPISRGQLRDTLAPLLQRRVEPACEEQSRSACRQRAVDHMASELTQELIDFSYEQLDMLRAALREGAVEEVRRHAHALRGSAAVLRQSGIAAACAEVDHQTYSGSYQKMMLACTRLQAAIDRLAE